MTGQTCGFNCPVCSHCDADIIGLDNEHILELRCQSCGWEFAVEGA